ncbi:MAG: response regulator [Pseudomonadota bacterium]
MKQTKWILLVDDEEEIRSSLRELLELTFGADCLRIVEAGNGIEATTKVNNQKFDCIVTDMKMPKKEGDAFIVSVRQNAFNEETPVVMLTGFPNRKIVEQFRFIYVVEKPFSHSDLTTIVGNQLKIGSGGERLAADMVNNLVQAATMFLTHTLKKENAHVGSPVAKKIGDDLSADFMSVVTMFDGKIHNSFSILVSEENLLKIRENFGNMKDSPLANIGSALGKTILNFAMKGMGRKMNFNIKSHQGGEIKEVVTPKRGILIPIQCDGIEVTILASGESKRKKAA